MSDAIVSFVDVNKTYDGKQLVVDSLNLEVHRGEFLTLLGASGSGKTSSLMMLAGFETPTSGEILLNGSRITRVPAHRRNFGVVFQNYALFPHMTVERNLAFPLEARRAPRHEIGRRIARVLDMVRLTGYGDRRPDQLSGGQQQRVALARALIFDPVLVLMDEPLGALDRQLRETMQYELKHTHDSLGLSVIYVTHDQGEALTMSDRIAVLNRGRIEQIASPADLYESPMTAYVAGFVGENNCLKGRLKAVDATSCRVETAWGSVQALAGNVGRIESEVILSLRPERALLNPAATSVENLFEGSVQEVIFLGDHIRMRLRIGDHDNFILKLPNSSRSSISGAAVGHAVKVGWRAEDCRALGAGPQQ